MAKFIIGHGCDSYIHALNSALVDTDDVMGHAIFKGASVVADQVRSEIQGLPVGSGSAGRNGAIVKTITPAQKSGLLDGLGIAKKRSDGGFVNVKIGEDGYNRTKSTKWPKGQPNAMIARSVESGTSFRSKNPFITRAVNATRAKAEAEMQKELDEQLKRYFK